MNRTADALIRRLAALTICAGIAVRVYFYWINRSLWLDEATLAINIVTRTFLGLLQPLEYNQGAPVGLLVLEKSLSRLLGTQDYVLRLVPFLAGTASVPLVFLTSRRYLGPLPSLIATLLFSVSWPLIYYSTELKQYSSDVLLTLLLLFLAPPCFTPDATRREYGLLGATGAIAIWFSHASLFAFASICCALGVWLLLRHDRKRLLWIGAIGGAWAISTTVVYFVSLRSLAANRHLLNYWGTGFAPLPPWKDLNWFATHLGDGLATIAYLPANALTLAITVVGIVSLAWKDWARALILVGAFLLTLAASSLTKYPFEGRLILFLVPLVFMFLAEGVESTRALVTRWNFSAAVLVVAALGSYFVYQSARPVYGYLIDPPMGEDMKPVMAFLDRNVGTEDVIYVSAGAVPAFRFYAPSYGMARNDVVLGVNSRRDPNGYLADIEKRVGARDCWFVFSHPCPNCPIDEQQYILSYLDSIGTRRASYSATGASVYHYSLH